MAFVQFRRSLPNSKLHDLISMFDDLKQQVSARLQVAEDHLVNKQNCELHVRTKKKSSKNVPDKNTLRKKDVMIRATKSMEGL